MYSQLQYYHDKMERLSPEEKEKFKTKRKTYYREWYQKKKIKYNIGNRSKRTIDCNIECRSPTLELKMKFD